MPLPVRGCEAVEPAALGGELKISAVFADEEVEIGVGREVS
jgi:hypothetical protein